MWVNGNLEANHVSGYTPFRLRLDNITSIKMGEEVVIAVFCDPDNGVRACVCACARARACICLFFWGGGGHDSINLNLRTPS